MKEVKFTQSGRNHFITVRTEITPGDFRDSTVSIDVVEVARNPKQLRHVLNGIANLIQSLQCHIPEKE